MQKKKENSHEILVRVINNISERWKNIVLFVFFLKKKKTTKKSQCVIRRNQLLYGFGNLVLLTIFHIFQQNLLSCQLT